MLLCYIAFIYIAFLTKIALLIFCLEFFTSMFVSELGLCFSFLVLLSLWFGTQIIMGSQGAEEFTYFFYSLEKGT